MECVFGGCGADVGTNTQRTLTQEASVYVLHETKHQVFSDVIN